MSSRKFPEKSNEKINMKQCFFPTISNRDYLLELLSPSILSQDNLKMIQEKIFG